MFPADSSGRSHIATTWFETIIADPGLLHASLYAALIRNKVTKHLLIDREELKIAVCQSESVQAINSRLSDPKPGVACGDLNIQSVFNLAFNSLRSQDSGSDSSSSQSQFTRPAQGPLGSLKMIDLYGGRIETMPVHCHGLNRMISVRGGLHKLELPGLGSQISYNDLIVASRLLERPSLHFVAGLDFDIATSLSVLRRVDRPLRQLGHGFRILKTLRPDSSDRLLTCLHYLSLYTLGIDDYLAVRPAAQSLIVIADQRNYVQHNLMTNIPNSKSPDTHDNDEDHLHTLCHLAATIYSLLCVFPIPAAPFHSLATRIRTILGHAKLAREFAEAPELMLWISVMGALASIGSSTGDRAWFVVALDRGFRRLKLESWDELRAILLRFLWFPSTNDYDGGVLWEEVEDSDPFDFGPPSQTSAGGVG
ncbi:hypothetical protein B0A52_01648 [Exophiala mesophila]|uniref:Transcription factor domain-containing protein n=1 Tax=Exophiala mesophila TaxID=212818 RepID=A0A438NFL4_EXOME|nr:hypothetical protein B0A52_01648 [Exophiala mesophila]